LFAFYVTSFAALCITYLLLLVVLDSAIIEVVNSIDATNVDKSIVILGEQEDGKELILKIII